MNQPTINNTPLFSLGEVVATTGALNALEKNGVIPAQLISRHVLGDWGEIPTDDATANIDAIRNGSRLLSSYTLSNDTRVWIITEADRSATTLLLPEEY